jgi:sugar lactone lactonase YvrE
MELSSRKVRHYAGKPGGRDGNFSGDGDRAALAGMAPSGLAFSPRGDLYVSDWSANRIRRIDRKSSVIETIAGNGEPKHPPRPRL